MRDLTKTPLVEILDDIEYTNKYIDSISIVIDKECDPKVRFSLIKEMHEAERYYKELEYEIKRRWGVDLSKEKTL